MGLFKFVGYTSTVSFVTIFLSLLLIPEALERTAIAWSMFRSPNSFTDYTLAYRVGIPACGFLLFIGILFIMLAT